MYKWWVKFGGRCIFFLLGSFWNTLYAFFLVQQIWEYDKIWKLLNLKRSIHVKLSLSYVHILAYITCIYAVYMFDYVHSKTCWDSLTWQK